MIAELVKQYDTLKRCNEPAPDPCFKELDVWIEIVLKPDGSFSHLNWLGTKDKQEGRRIAKEKPCKDLDCPVTEKSAVRSVGNESPHGLVDNAMWIFGKLATEKQTQRKIKIEQAILTNP